jgi:hypothetical protein
MMFFTAITKDATTYGVGQKLGVDRYRTKDGVTLYFYDTDSIRKEFGGFGLIEATKIDEAGNGKPATRFWKVVCKKTDIPQFSYLNKTPHLCYNSLEHRFYYSQANRPLSYSPISKSLISILQVVLHFCITPLNPNLDTQTWLSAL